MGWGWGYNLLYCVPKRADLYRCVCRTKKECAELTVAVDPVCRTGKECAELTVGREMTRTVT